MTPTGWASRSLRPTRWPRAPWRHPDFPAEGAALKLSVELSTSTRGPRSFSAVPGGGRGASLARRAGELRHLAARGSAVNAVVVASAEPGGVVLTGDIEDLGALASHADAVRIERI